MTATGTAGSVAAAGAGIAGDTAAAENPAGTANGGAHNNAGRGRDEAMVMVGQPGAMMRRAGRGPVMAGAETG